jgi:hypothetical protein
LIWIIGARRWYVDMTVVVVVPLTVINIASVIVLNPKPPLVPL